MSAIEAIREGSFGEPPAICPIGGEIPKNRQEYTVPVEFRARLALVIEARREANVPGRGDQYYAKLASITHLAAEVDSAMFQLVGNPMGIAVEYHSGWKFSILTEEDVVHEHKAFESILGHKSEDTFKGGPTLNYMLAQTPERCHLSAYYARHELQEYLAHVRRTHVPLKESRT